MVAKNQINYENQIKTKSSCFFCLINKLEDIRTPDIRTRSLVSEITYVSKIIFHTDALLLRAILHQLHWWISNTIRPF